MASSSNGTTIPSNRGDIGWLINRLNSVRAEQLAEALGRFGLTPRSSAVLKAVNELPAPVSQQAIAWALYLDQASVAIVADKLDADGLIVRRRDQSNRRRYVVELTEEGQQLVEQIKEPSRSIEVDMSRGLDEKETVLLRELLQRVAAAHGIT